MKKCEICGVTEESTRIIKSNGSYLCRKHYLQIYRHGKTFKTIYDPNEIKIMDKYAIIKITDMSNLKYDVLVDLDDLEKIKKYKWHIKKSTNTNYAISSKGDNKLFIHRLVLNYEGDLDVDHINHNGLDNRKNNLRIISHSKNIMNQHNDDNGIYKLKNNRFRATITKNNKGIYIGTYDTFEEAKTNRKIYEEKLF